MERINRQVVLANRPHGPLDATTTEIREVPVAPLEEGQALVVMESMKMQMQIRSPQAGRVASVHVQGGQQVDKGSLLVKVEAS